MLRTPHLFAKKTMRSWISGGCMAQRMTRCWLIRSLRVGMGRNSSGAGNTTARTISACPYAGGTCKEFTDEELRTRGHLPCFVTKNTRWGAAGGVWRKKSRDTMRLHGYRRWHTARHVRCEGRRVILVSRSIKREMTGVTALTLGRCTLAVTWAGKNEMRGGDRLRDAGLRGIPPAIIIFRRCRAGLGWFVVSGVALAPTSQFLGEQGENWFIKPVLGKSPRWHIKQSIKKNPI